MFELFNYGDNDGTIKFIAIDNTVIKCHEFVFTAGSILNGSFNLYKF